MKVSALLMFAAAVAGAQTKFEFWPGTQYDPAIPTLDKTTGFALAERLASPAQVTAYFQALAAAAPNRMKLYTYGKSWENRPLIVAAISSEANIRRLPEIQAGMKKLADPRGMSDADAKRLAASLPAVILLTYSVHGNEISCTDAALMTAYHLLAARSNDMVAKMLQNTVVLIDPLQNPDGRNRFVHNYEVAEGLEADGFTFAAERDEPWPGGRSNHYHFDMNRDWFAMTQPETRARVKTLLDWFPLVVADVHEMGSESTYFFAPGSAPYNPYITRNQREGLSLFGKNNAKWFDQFGFSYFTREVFDEFYPGYGASWPYNYGAIGMTYENASVRGLKYRRNDGTIYDYPSSVQRHFVASIATVETAATNRQALLDNFLDYRRTAIEEGKTGPVKEYILARRGDVSAVDKLAQLLAAQGIEVDQAAQGFSAGGKDFPAGSYRISLAQPQSRMARNYLDPEIPMEKPFIDEQERRRRRKLRDEIYDVTGWSLPLLYNVESVALNAPAPGNFTRIDAAKPPAGRIDGGKPSVAYLIPWGQQSSARLLTSMLREGLRVHSADRGFTLGGRKYPAGSLIVQVKQNPASVHDTMAKLVPPSGAEVFAANTSWVEDGINFGSNNTLLIQRPKIALAWDSPVSSLSAGHTRWLLERQYGYPVTVIRTSRLGFADLSQFQVLILPEGNYGAALGGAAPRLKAWVQQGGTLIGLGAALGFLTDPKVGMLSLQAEALSKPDAPKPPAPADGPIPGKILTKEEEFLKAIEPDKESPDDVAGVIVRAKVDQEHWLTAGVPETVQTLVSGRAIYAPIKIDKGVNAVVFRGPEELVASGYLWAENKRQLAYKPFLVVERSGRGHVIGFTVDPNFRGYMDGLNLLFLNAVFRGAAHSGQGFGAAAEQ
jgi:hypothetical protein